MKRIVSYRLKFPVAKYLQGNNQKHNAHHVSQKRFNQVILCQSSGKNTLRRKKEGNAYNISLILQWFDWHAIID